MEKRHEKADAFRRRIEFVTQRQIAITELLQKSSFSTSDELKLQILFQKKQYLQGCEIAYRLLIEKIGEMGSEKMKKKTLSFAKKLRE